MKAQTIITTTRLPKRRWLAHAMAAALFAASALAVTQPAQARVFVSVNIAPPLLPIYEQPSIPGPGYIWTPGFWAYDYDYGYYWVPGTWVLAPYVGALWTPGYWGWNDNAYAFYPGYWGLSVGYYGGIDYGFGYTGIGYYGGYWDHGAFFYNTAVNRVGSVNISTVYNKTVVGNTTASRASFNGPNGVTAQPTAAQLAASRERRSGPVSAQIRQQTLASHNQALRASVNHGTPSITATPRAGVFPRGGATTAAALAAGAAANHAMHSASTRAAARATALNERMSTRAERRTTFASRETVHRAASMRSTSTHELRTSPVRMSRQESIRSRPIVQHHDRAMRVNDFAGSPMRSSGPSMHQARQSTRGGNMPTIMRSEGPHAGPGMRMEARQAPAPRGGGGGRNPSGGGGDKRGHHGGG